MILTQTFAELGCPLSMESVGIYTDAVEPVDQLGYGYEFNFGRNLALESFNERLQQKGENFVVLNAKIEVLPGAGSWRSPKVRGDIHLGNHRKLFVLTGDLYKLNDLAPVETEALFDWLKPGGNDVRENTA